MTTKSQRSLQSKKQKKTPKCNIKHSNPRSALLYYSNPLQSSVPWMPVVQEESGFTFIVNKLHLYSYFMPRLRSLYSLCCVPTVVLWCQRAHCSLLMNNRFHHSHKNLCISTVCKTKSKQEAQQLFFVFQTLHLTVSSFFFYCCSASV